MRDSRCGGRREGSMRPNWRTGGWKERCSRNSFWVTFTVIADQGLPLYTGQATSALDLFPCISNFLPWWYGSRSFASFISSFILWLQSLFSTTGALLLYTGWMTMPLLSSSFLRASFWSFAMLHLRQFGIGETTLYCWFQWPFLPANQACGSASAFAFCCMYSFFPYCNWHCFTVLSSSYISSR